MRFLSRAEDNTYEPMSDDQIEILASTMANVSAALACAPDKVQKTFEKSQEDLRQARFAGQLAADELAKVYFN